MIDSETTELWGVDIGCRTCILYSPHDLACLWDKWTVVDPPGRSLQLRASIVKANRVGVNIVAYATGREPPNKLEARNRPEAPNKKDETEKPPGPSAANSRSRQRVAASR